MKKPLTKADLNILNQLSHSPFTSFCYNTVDPQKGCYILYASFVDNGSYSGYALDFDGTLPRVVLKGGLRKLENLKILKRKKFVLSSVHGHDLILNKKSLKDFEQLKEISIQLALGTWYTFTNKEVEIEGNYP